MFKHKYSHLLAIFAFVVSLVIIFGWLGQLPLTQPDEARNAEVAREVHQSGTWLIPTYNGLAYLDKPIFYFKTVALSFSIFGELQGAARFSSAVFGFLLLVVLFTFCKREYDIRTATLAVLIVATTPLYFVFSRLVIFDMTLAFFVCTAIFASYHAETREGRARSYWYLIAAAAAGAATLVKGPIGFIIPTLVIWVFNWLDGRKGAMKRFLAWPNLLLFSAVVLPWFVGVTLIHNDFPYYGIVKESLQRLTTDEFHRNKPFYFFGPVIALSFLAWSILLPESVITAWKLRAKWSSADRLFIVWAIVVVLFFSISQSKVPSYVLSAVVALGILTARTFIYAFDNRNGRAARIVLHGTLALALVSTVISLVLAVYLFRPEMLQQLLNIQNAKSALFAPAIAPMAYLLAVVAFLAYIALVLRNARFAFAAFLAFPLLLMTVGHSVFSVYADKRSARALADQIPTLTQNTEIACLECFPSGLDFYLHRYVTVLSKDGVELSSNYILFRLKTAKVWPDTIVPLAEHRRWLATRNHPVYLMADDDELPQLKAIAAAANTDIQKLTRDYWGVLLPAATQN